MRESIEKEISGATFTFSQWSPTKTLARKGKLIQILGPAVASFIDGDALKNVMKDVAAGKDVADVDVKADALRDAVGHLSEKMAEDGFVDFMKELMDGVQCSYDGKVWEVRQQFDALFREIPLSAVYQVIFKQIAYQYSDFLPALAGAADRLARAKKKSPSLKTSSGPSGE